MTFDIAMMMIYFALFSGSAAATIAALSTSSDTMPAIFRVPLTLALIALAAIAALALLTMIVAN